MRLAQISGDFALQTRCSILKKRLVIFKEDRVGGRATAVVYDWS